MDIKQLRSGEPTLALVDQLTIQVSEWLLSNDLNVDLENAVNNAQGERIRVVLNIDRDILPKLSDVPVELIELKNTGLPLVLSPKVESMVHLLPGVGGQGNIADPSTWPLRVLIVRSNPPDLGRAVPRALPIRKALLETGKRVVRHLGPGLSPEENPVLVDLLSDEPGVKKPATWQGLRNQLASANYHILIYLGHGDVLQTHEGVQPGGVLQMESEDGKGHDSVGFKQLRVEFMQHPVPVVVLAGCLTAVGVAKLPDSMKKGIEELKPQWIRGSQGVAQALVDSDSGVQFAVGMRYMLETNSAVRFIKAFFSSLLLANPGNVEEAVRAGRQDLHAKSPFPPSWSAPMIFRSLGQEPMFGFMKTPPDKPIDPVVTAKQDAFEKLRLSFLQSLEDVPLSSLPTRRPDPLKPLNDIEKELLENARSIGPVIMPQRVLDAQPSQQVVVPVLLHGNLNIKLLKGEVRVSGSAKIAKLEARPELAANGYDFLFGLREGGATFRIEHQASLNGLLPEGPIFDAHIDLSTDVPARYVVSVVPISTDPKTSYVASNNSVLVLRP
jgi:hypothetical protein